jgi:GNAT superfamily N-acetyltransferase
MNVRPLSTADWPDIERLFGARGACGGCWCMEWRREGTAREVREYRGEPNRLAFRDLVERGLAHGVLAFDAEGEPVGWCSVDVSRSFAALDRKRSLRTGRDERTWSITCFFVRAGHRGRGIGEALAREAVRLAFASGATRVEAYPAKSGGRAKLPAPFVWTGTESMFIRAGFRRDPANPRVFALDAPEDAKAERRTRAGTRS